MRTVLQRVLRASVVVEGREVSGIDRGLLVLVGVEKGDDRNTAAALARRCVSYRIFADDTGRMNLSLKDVGGRMLVVSQFTLAADTAKGLRPGFDPAERPERAKEMLDVFCRTVREEGVEALEGVFGAHMQVGLINDGPVTFCL